MVPKKFRLPKGFKCYSTSAGYCHGESTSLDFSHKARNYMLAKFPKNALIVWVKQYMVQGCFQPIDHRWRSLPQGHRINANFKKIDLIDSTI